MTAIAALPDILEAMLVRWGFLEMNSNLQVR